MEKNANTHEAGTDARVALSAGDPRVGVSASFSNTVAHVTDVTIENLTKSTASGNVLPINHRLTTESHMFDHAEFATEYRSAFTRITTDECTDDIETVDNITTVMIEQPTFHADELTIKSTGDSIIVRHNGEMRMKLPITTSAYAVAYIVNGLAISVAE